MRIYGPEMRWVNGVKPNGEQILKTITECGRVSYQSQKQGGYDIFVKSLIDRGHESVLEHASIGVVVSCDRSVSHEIVRHRIAAYTQESTRYCNYSGDRFDKEVKYISITGGIDRDQKMKGLSGEQMSLIIDEWLNACRDAEAHYFRMLELGASAQIARSVLNNSTRTEIAITMNIREWRHFFKLRTAQDAHPQMRELTEKMLKEFKRCVPVVFEDC